MRSTNDLPINPLGSLGAPIRPAAPPAPDVVKPFEQQNHDLLNDQSKALETIAETLRKKSIAPIVHIDDETCDLREPFWPLREAAPGVYVFSHTAEELAAIAEAQRFIAEWLEF